MITNSEINSIIQEEINRFISEGIDIKNDNIVTVTPEHQNNIDINDPYNPYLIQDNQRGFETLSIFQRKSDLGNALMNALKQRNGWKFEDVRQSLGLLFRRFIAAAHLLPHYDSIIMTPSKNKLNQLAFNYLIRMVPHDWDSQQLFSKLDVGEVYSAISNSNYIETHFPNSDEVWHEIEEAFYNMIEHNDGVFSYKYLRNLEYRDIILQSLKVNTELQCADHINGKNVLVFDDIITTGKTISDSAKAINETFTPASLTFLTLFSAMDNPESNQKRIYSM